MRHTAAVSIALFLCVIVAPITLGAQENLEAGNMQTIRTHLTQGRLEEARDLIDRELERTAGSKRVPFVENGTLYLYAETSEESLMLQLAIAALQLGPAGDWEKEPWSKELNALPAWKRMTTVVPYRPFLFFSRAYLAVEEKDLEEAAIALDEAIALFPHYLPALAEKVHVLMVTGKFDAAKELARAAIEDTYPQAVKGKAIIFRKLGYIAIEEGDLDLAVEYYHKSLELEPGNKVALDELKYIESIRKK